MSLSNPIRKNDFDALAPYYDKLKDWTLGQVMHQSELAHLDNIPDDANVLIIGGGGGEIVDMLYSKKKGIQLTYIEQSQKMIDIAKERVGSIKYGNQITFVNKSFELISSLNMYDVVITHYFLDVFTPTHLTQVIGKIKNTLAFDGILLVADFQRNKKWYNSMWQTPVLLGMHIFFRFFTNLESSSLKDIDGYLKGGGFSTIKECHYWNRFIFSRVYKLSR